MATKSKSKSKKTSAKKQEGTFLVISPSNTGAGVHIVEHTSERAALEGGKACRKAMADLRVPGEVLVVRLVARVEGEFVPQLVS